MVDFDFSKMRENLISATSSKVADAVSSDILIIQALNTIDDLTVQINGLSKRLREWHSYCLPQVDNSVSDNETFVELISTKSFDELTSEFSSNANMVAKLSDEDYAPIVLFATQIAGLIKTKSSLLTYLESLLKVHMPNVSRLAGDTICARLLASAGSLKRLAMVPASTVQLFGAEKALFRHLKTGAKSPKFGHIFNHQLIQRASSADAGRVARALADKLAICAKLDFFKGEFLADQYIAELDKKFRK